MRRARPGSRRSGGPGDRQPVGGHSPGDLAGGVVGVSIVEESSSFGRVESGSSVDAAIARVAAGLDALALAADPLGSLPQYGVAWLIEHVERVAAGAGLAGW